MVKPVDSPAAPKDFSFEGGTLKVALPMPASTVSEMSVSSALAAASWSGSKRKGKEGKTKGESKGQVKRDGAGGPDVDIIIVGAGASGVGVGHALLTHFGISRDRMLLLERGSHVGTSFRLWPKEMRFISPSFNQIGWTSSFDLNSIASGTSPAVFTKEEHPTGEQYANYVEAVARDVTLPIRFGVDVTQILPVGKAGQPKFEVHVQSCTSSHEAAVQSSADSVKTIIRCRFVIWAAGEFQYPKRSCGFPGAQLCRHNSTVHSWAAHPGKEFIVIGGYESGIDAAVNLASSNRAVTMLASSPCWDETSCDPSSELAPSTRARLKRVMEGQYSSKLQLFSGMRVTKVEYNEEKYLVHATHSETQQDDTEQTNTVDKRSQQEEVYVTPNPPILGVGFEGSIAHLVKDLFDWEQAETSNPQACITNVSTGDAAHKEATSGSAATGNLRLTLEDESTKTRGLFLVGPQVSH
jgi:hypothetical protein